MKKLFGTISALFFSFLLLIGGACAVLADEDELTYTKLSVSVDPDDLEQDTGDDIWELIATGKLNLTITATYKGRNQEKTEDIHPSMCDIYPDTIQKDKNTYTISYKDDSRTRKSATFRLTGTGKIRETFEQNENNGKWYMQAYDGGYYTDVFKNVDGHWYLFDSSGYLVKGWQERLGRWYYLDEKYRLVTGWYTENGIKYYLDPQSGGAMCTEWAFVNNTWYRFKENGVFASGWIQDNGKWYYINPDGTMYMGWLNLNNIWYYLTPGSGDAAVGWKVVDGKWYYFASNAAMAVNTTIDNYYVGNDGAWIP